MEDRAPLAGTNDGALMVLDLRAQIQSTLGDAYTLERELGGGGMSRVFVALEKSLGRQVVVKVLPPEMAGQVSSDRFRREIGVAATLQHAHIVPLLTAGDAGGLPYFTMPYVRGESLRERIAKHGELPVSEAMRILREVASALAFAHDAGVVHRDIKPDNILIAGGAAMVTDFGVAKALSASTTSGSSGLTSLGVALGTPAYMSPEQASADPHVDHRADIYSWGVLAYELLTGGTPFANRPPHAMLAAHVSEQPEEVTRRRVEIPPALATLVMHCLSKRAANRPQTAGELLIALDAITTPSGGSAPTSARIPAVRVSRTRLYAAAGGALALLAIAFAIKRPRGLVAVQVGTVTPIAVSAGIEIEPSLSPDGKLVAYSAGNPGDRRIYVQQIAGGRAVPLTTDLAGDHGSPSWSPDGSRIAFESGNAVYIVPALGGTPRLFTETAGGGTATPSWSPDGKRIAYVGAGGVFVKDVEGGAAQLVAVRSPAYSPVWSPDGRQIAYVNGFRPNFTNVSATSIWVVTPSGGAPQQVTTEIAVNTSPAWAPDSRSLFFVSNREGTPDVYRQALTAGGGTSGEPQRITTGLNARNIALSADGARLAYDVVRNRSNIWTVTLPPSGSAAVAAATQVTSDAQRIEGIGLSRDGEWLAYDSDRSGNFDIYKMRIGGGPAIQLTTSHGHDFAPAWSPDDREIAFHSARTGTREIYVVGADGGGESQVTRSSNAYGGMFFPDWIDGGRGLVFWGQDSARFGLLTVTRDAGGAWSQPKRLASDSAKTAWPRLSPDGRLIAIDGGGTAITAKYLAVMPASGGALRVLYTARTNGEIVRRPAWGRDPNTVFFATTDSSGRFAFWSVPVTGGTPRLHLRDDVKHRLARWDFATDGTRFFFTLAADESDVFVVALKK